MISEEQLENLTRAFRYIFLMPISSMTLNEVFNAINTTFPGNQELAEEFYGALLTGEIKEKLGNSDELTTLIETYSIPTRLAKEIAERGEFINSFSSDFIQQQNQLFFLNRMRRIDGESFQFYSAPEINIRLAHMFINRLRDLKKSVGKNLQIDPRITEEIEQIKEDIQDLLS